MVDTNKALSQRAGEYAEQLAHQNAQQKKRLEEAQLQVAKAKAEIDLSSRAPQRLLDFRPSLSGQYQCPYCWVVSGVQSAIHPIGGGTRHEDIFACDTCRSEFVIEF